MVYGNRYYNENTVNTMSLDIIINEYTNLYDLYYNKQIVTEGFIEGVKEVLKKIGKVILSLIKKIAEVFKFIGNAIDKIIGSDKLIVKHNKLAINILRKDTNAQKTIFNNYKPKYCLNIDKLEKISYYTRESNMIFNNFNNLIDAIESGGDFEDNNEFIKAIEGNYLDLKYISNEEELFISKPTTDQYYRFIDLYQTEQLSKTVKGNIFKVPSSSINILKKLQLVCTGSKIIAKLQNNEESIKNTKSALDLIKKLLKIIKEYNKGVSSLSRNIISKSRKEYMSFGFWCFKYILNNNKFRDKAEASKNLGFSDEEDLEEFLDDYDDFEEDGLDNANYNWDDNNEDI